eukprot:CAMPEP_0179341182 /NCGR_PEP_ID=MMETSP0797-20121207/69698_1 /TAXON_ID=47934 /ORGANISM="Dinophysis acuminata, Strain DAEP01" /LENGTH=302 /DNA_ID=CAMNT_0021055235 /DNA_START=381 /DNA_END=1289 /DNA_ORIENTATION=+
MNSSSSGLAFISKQRATANAIGAKIWSSDQMLDALRAGSFTVATLVQRYFADPYLVNGHKADIRIYALVRTDPLRIYIHRDGWVWVAQRPFSMQAVEDGFVHFTNQVGVAPESTEAHKAARRMSLRQFAQEMGRERWHDFWELAKRNVVKAVLSFIWRQDCRTGDFQRTGKQRCGRFFQLYGIDCYVSSGLDDVRVYEVNNNPGVHLYRNPHTTSSQSRMFRDVYGDSAELLGFEPGGAFIPWRLWEEWDHRGSFDLAYPPMDGDFDRAGFSWFKALQYLPPETKEEYRKLFDHIRSVGPLD